MSRIEPYYPPGGTPVPIAIIGEAPGAEEEKQGKPFVGASGRELTQMLHEARIIRGDCFLSNVFLDRPPENKLDYWCVKKKEADALWQEEGHEGKYPNKALSPGKYLQPHRLDAIERLKNEIITMDPNVIVALGNTPLWALTGEGGITKLRGTILEIDIGGPRPYKLLPTFHPAFILRKWDARLICVADFMKAKEESKSSTLKRPKREIWLEPSLDDIIEFRERFLKNAPKFAWDIETIPKGGFITCIGFGTETHAICIPFFDSRNEDGNYWKDREDEKTALNLIRNILTLPGAKITQNGMYDMFWTWKQLGIFPSGDLVDTQLLHHSMYPELKKDLGTLGSLYTNEIAWKKLNPIHRTEGKKDA